MPAKIHVERMMYRNSVAVKGESAASYALIKLIPTGESASKPMGLNLALVLDVSGSMYEEDGTGIPRLKRVQDAALSAIETLKPEDNLALVAFAHDTEVVLPSTSLAEKAKIIEIVNAIDRNNVDPGGTAMNLGMEAAYQELQKNAGSNRLSQMVVLTDGETSGELQCKDMSQALHQEKINLTLMGVGTDWKASLVKDLAKLGNGKWYYIASDQASSAERVFLEEFHSLAAATFMDVEMHLRPVKDVKLKRVRQVVPQIKELPLAEPEERHLIAQLGMLEKDKSTRYILDLSLPARPDGNYVICQMEVTYNVGGQKESTGMVPLQVSYTPQQGYINAEVARHIDEVQIFELNNNLQQAIAVNNAPEVQRLAESIEKKAVVMGPRAAKKTMLARQVLQEMNAGGRVSKKTQLAMEDISRSSEDQPS